MSQPRLFEPSETSRITKAESACLKALLSVTLVDKPSECVSSGGALNSGYMENWAEPALVEALAKGVPKLYVPPGYDDR